MSRRPFWAPGNASVIAAESAPCQFVRPGGRRPRWPRIATGWARQATAPPPLWRPPTTVAEDRNFVACEVVLWHVRLAAADHGGRGSQPCAAVLAVRTLPAGGRRPRWPRIATSRPRT